MNAERVTTRIAGRRSASVRLPSDRYNPAFGLSAAGIVFAACAAFALLSTDRIFGVAIGAVGLMLLSLAIGGFVLQSGMKEGVVRTTQAAAGTRFVAPLTSALFSAGAGVFGIVAAVVAIGSETSNGRTPGWGSIALGVVSALLVGQFFFSLSTPPGLTVTEAGLRGVRGSKNVELGWDGLAHAQVDFARGARLLLTTTAGGAIVVDPRFTGSDPNVVAPFIIYFLEHPEHRALLADPQAALRHVDRAMEIAAGDVQPSS